MPLARKVFVAVSLTSFTFALITQQWLAVFCALGWLLTELEAHYLSKGLDSFKID